MGLGMFNSNHVRKDRKDDFAMRRPPARGG